jgi:glycosidase
MADRIAPTFPPALVPLLLVALVTVPVLHGCAAEAPPGGDAAGIEAGAETGPQGATNDRQAAAVPPGEPQWAASTALYELFVRDFSETGDFQGVVAGLDRVQATGAEVVWLMPIHPIGEVRRKGTLGSPYSVRDYRAVNPDFGTEEDFRALVEAVHARGMKVMLGWVPNHTAWDHVWVEAHPDFYVRDEEGGLTVPRDPEGTLTDWTDVAQLDYRNPALRRAMIDAMRYWIDAFDVDGFRVDVAGFVPLDFYHDAIPELRAAKDGPLLMLAEWGDPEMHTVGFDLTYPWDSYARLKEVWAGAPARSFVEAEVDALAGMPEGALRMRMTTNHDETAWDAPPVQLFGGSAGARAAFVAMALLPGPTLIYNGQEIESPQPLPLFEKVAIDWDRPGADGARAFYREVVELARSHPELVGGTLEPVATDAPGDVIAYRRGELLVLVNARDREVDVRLADPWADAVILGEATTEHGAVRLGPYGFVVLGRASGRG